MTAPRVTTFRGGAARRGGTSLRGGTTLRAEAVTVGPGGRHTGSDAAPGGDPGCSPTGEAATPSARRPGAAGFASPAEPSSDPGRWSGVDPSSASDPPGGPDPSSGAGRGAGPGTPDGPDGPDSGRAGFWRRAYGPRTWKELAWSLLGLPLAIGGFVFVVTTTSVSVSLGISFVGIPLLTLALVIERRFGQGYRWLGRHLLGIEVAEPPQRPGRTGFLGRLGRILSDPVSWRSWAYLLLRFPLGIASFVVATVAWTWTVGMITYPTWFWAVSYTDRHGQLRHGAQFWFDAPVDTALPILAVVAAGVAMLLLAPWLVRATTTVERWLLRALLGPTRTSERMLALEATRATAVDSSAARLRRIERDLHDGTQAQLVALAMQLGMAKEELAGAQGPAQLATAQRRLEAAHAAAKDALGELRDVVRGIHPPSLDVGLAPALETLTARTALPVSLQVELASRPSPAIETIAYFSVAELLTNVVRHSGATRASVSVTDTGGRQIRIVVSDDGHGGAVASRAPTGAALAEASTGDPGAELGEAGRAGGLAGLQERAATVDGRLSVSSPTGGPTVVTIDLPIHA